MSERHALPHRSQPRGLGKLESAPRLAPSGAPPPQAHSGAYCAARPPRSPRQRLSAVTPISGPRACSLRRRRAWARAPERALRPEKHLLCTEPGKVSPSLLAFMAAGWGTPGRPECQGAGGAGLHGARTFPFIFPPPHPQPSFSQLCEAGRTDVKQAPLPLPRGRWPARPHSLALHQRLPGEAAGQSRCPRRAAPDSRHPRGPGRRTRVPEGSATAGGEGCAPPRPHP